MTNNDSDCMKKEETLNQILVFMKHDDHLRNKVFFDFKPSEEVRYFDNTFETTADGQDLINLKKILKSKHHKLIFSALDLAVHEKFVKNTDYYNKYKKMALTETGYARAKSFEIDKNNAWKKNGAIF